MGLSDVTTHPGDRGDRGDVRTGDLPDGSRVTVRPSADGRPINEIAELNQNGVAIRGRTREIRYCTN